MPVKLEPCGTPEEARRAVERARQQLLAWLRRLVRSAAPGQVAHVRPSAQPGGSDAERDARVVSGGG